MAGVESKLQTKIKKELQSNGWKVIKTILLSESGHADLFCFKDGRTVFLEIKATNGVESELQKYRQKEMMSYGFTYEFIRSLEQFKELNL